MTFSGAAIVMMSVRPRRRIRAPEVKHETEPPHRRPFAAFWLRRLVTLSACGGGRQAPPPSSTPTAARPAPRRTGRHRGLSRQGELPRPDARRPGWQWPRMFRLPHGHRELPAHPGRRAGKAGTDDHDRRRRSAVSRDRCRRLSHQRRRRARLHQPDAERPGPRHDPSSRERQAARLRRGGSVSGIGAPDQRDRCRRLALRPLDPRRQHHRPRRAGPRGRAAPNPNGGYQLDGRIDTLQDQALGALRNHAGTAFDPPARFLDDLAAFQGTQFSSPSVKALVGAIRCDEPAARSRPVAERARGGGQGRLQSRLRAVSRQPGRPSERQHADPARRAGHAHRARRATTTSRPRVRGRSTPSTRRASLRALQREPDEERADLRDHEQRRRAERHALRRRRAAAGVRHARHDVRSGPSAAYRLPGRRRPRATSSTWTSRTCAESAGPRLTS